MPLSSQLVGTPEKGLSQSWYRPLLKSAVLAAFKHKFIWFFGFFAAILGAGNEILVVADSFSRAQNQGPLYENLKTIFFSENGFQFLGPLQSLLATPGFENVLIAGGVLVLLMLFFLFLALVSQGALVFSAFHINEKSPVTWNTAWKRGVQKFWPVLATNLIGKIFFGIGYLLFTLPILFLYSGNPSGLLQVLLTLLAFLIIIPLILLISLFVRLMVIAVVSHDTTFANAWEQTRSLFGRHWLVIIEFVILLFLIDVIVYVALRVGMAVLALPFLFAISLFYAFSVPIGASASYILWIILSVLFVFFVAAFVSSFQYVAWVQLYQHLIEGSITAKLVRFIKHFSLKTRLAKP